jgi:hypothetical protein
MTSRSPRHHDRKRTGSRISQDRWYDEFRGVTTRDNMRDMMEYRVSVRYTDELVYADEEIRIEVFGKTSSTILLNSQLSMRNRYGTEATEAHGR